MQFNIIPAGILFLGSYFPLSVILLLQDISEQSWKLPVCTTLNFSKCELPSLAAGSRSIPFFLVTLASFLLFMVVMNKLKGQQQIEVIDARTIPNDLINYVFPYVVSFMGLDLTNNGKFFGFLLFLGWMFLITYRSGQILMNPLLLAGGWQLYELEIKTEQKISTVRALSKENISAGIKVKSCVVQGIYVLVKGKS